MMAMGLPNHRELPPSLVTFLEQHFITATPYRRRVLGLPDDNTTTPTNSTTCDTRHHRDYGLSSPTSSHLFTLLCNTASDLASELRRDCDELEAHLLQLHQNLSKLLISWLSRSIAAKPGIQKLNKVTTITPCQYC